MTEDLYDKLSNPLAMAVFIITLLIPLAVGLIAMLKTRSQSDFFLGGRAMSSFVVGLSAVSSGRSSWLVLGVSGMAYVSGVGAIWAIVGYTIVEAWQFIYLGRYCLGDDCRNHYLHCLVSLDEVSDRGL